MSKRTIASLAAGIVIAGATAATVWTGANALATIGIAAGAGVSAVLFTWFIWAKIAAALAKRGR